MPALNFPSSPTNGQTYGNYIYDSSITAWRNVNSETGIAALNGMVLKMVVPTSVTVSSGSAITSANGLVTYSGAGTITLNGVFTSTYSNYLIMYDFSAISANGAFYHRMSLAGTVDSSANYGTFAANSRSASGTNGLVFDGNGANANSAWMGATYTGAMGRQGGQMVMKGPAKAGYTMSFIQAMHDNGGGTWGYLTEGAAHGVATAYDGIQFYNSSGTISGTIQVYGYAQ